MGVDGGAGATQPSAPPMAGPSGSTYPSVPPGYPPIVAAGAPVQHPSGSIQQPLPQQHMPQQQPVPAVMHPSALPAVRPPAVHVLEQHTYVHLPSQEEPLITHSSCAMPRQITCPMCFRQGPTMVTRQPGCCAYLACFGLCWVCCPLFWLPFCLDCDKDVVHTCGACGTEIARIKPCS